MINSQSLIKQTVLNCLNKKMVLQENEQNIFAWTPLPGVLKGLEMNKPPWAKKIAETFPEQGETIPSKIRPNSVKFTMRSKASIPIPTETRPKPVDFLRMNPKDIIASRFPRNWQNNQTPSYTSARDRQQNYQRSFYASAIAHHLKDFENDHITKKLLGHINALAAYMGHEQPTDKPFHVLDYQNNSSQHEDMATALQHHFIELLYGHMTAVQKKKREILGSYPSNMEGPTTVKKSDIDISHPDVHPIVREILREGKRKLRLQQAKSLPVVSGVVSGVKNVLNRMSPPGEGPDEREEALAHRKQLDPVSRGFDFLHESTTLDKETPTPKQIARKHHVSVQLVKKRLKDGMKIEGEHSQKKGVQREIALDHLGEDPGYYGKLKKVER
jgi:hypothetical protein